MNRWTLIRLDRCLGDYGAEWDALHARLFRPNPMLDSRFIDELLRHFGDGTEYLAVFRSGGIARSMCVIKRRKIGVWSTFLPANTQIGPALIGPSADIPRLISTLRGKGIRFDVLCNDPDFGDLSQSAFSTGTKKDHALTMSIRLNGGFGAYWSGRSKKLVQNIGRYERRCIADGMAVRFTCIADSAGLLPAIARYGELESKGWKGQQGTAVAIDNPQGAFYVDLTRRFAGAGGACVYELWLGDHLAASRITICTSKTVVMLKTAYDEALQEYAPGRLLLRDVIRHAFETYPDGVIEFCTDANADLLSWATEQRWTRHVSYYHSAISIRIIQTARACRKLLIQNFAPPTKPVITIDVHPHPDDLPPDVRHLFDRAEKDHMELGIAWFRNLTDCVYPGQGAVSIYVLRKNGQPMAALPMRADTTIKTRQVHSLSNYYSAIFAPALAPTISPKDLAQLIRSIRLNGVRPASLRFAPMDPESPGFRTLEAALKLAGLPTFRFFCFGNWYLTPVDTWAEYLQGRKGALRSTIKRMGKKFAADAGRIEIIANVAELEAGLKAYEQVYGSSWKIPEPYPAFVPGLAAICGEQGWLRLGVAWLKDEPIAAQLWIVANNKASIYKVAYDERYKAYAPGTLLTSALMQHAIENDKVKEVDYLIGDDPYKQSWMNRRRERWGLIAYNPRSIAGIIGSGRELMVRSIKSMGSYWRNRTAPTAQ